MENDVRGRAATRRHFMQSTAALAGALALPAGFAPVSAAIAAGQIKDVPRNRTPGHGPRRHRREIHRA